MQTRMPASGTTNSRGRAVEKPVSPPQRIAISAAAMANGRAKIVWLKRTSSR
jgi:hypothetical protein